MRQRETPIPERVRALSHAERERLLARIEVLLIHGNLEAIKLAVLDAHRVADVLEADAPVSQLPGLSVRVANALERAGIRTVNALQYATESEILAIPSCGILALQEIAAALKNSGFSPDEIED